MTDKPKAKTSQAEQEINRAEQQFKAHEEHVKSLTLDRMNAALVQDVEPQTKLSQRDIEKSKDIYLKPNRSITSQEKFNESYREDYNFAKEYVQFVAEHKELIGENIEVWTKPFAGMPAEFWIVPTNKPVWGPRYLAEQITKAQYCRLKMDQSTIVGADGMGTYTGGITIDQKIKRLDAIPVTSRKSVFMGASAFR